MPPGRYVLDEHHWSIIFDVDHFKFTRFTMRFDRATAQLDWKEGGLDASFGHRYDRRRKRRHHVPLLDKMVKSSDMLDVAQNPEIRFASTRFERTGDARGKLTAI